MSASDDKKPRAVVVGVQLTGVNDVEHQSSLEELTRLATTLGLEVIGQVSQKRGQIAKASVVGSGRLVELASWTGGDGVIPSGANRRKRRIDVDKDEEQSVDTEDTDTDDEFADASADAETDSDVDADAAHMRPKNIEPATVVLVDHDLSPSQSKNLENATGAQVLDRSSVILSIFQRHARTREAKLQVEIARLEYLAPRLREGGGGSDRQRGGIGGKGAGESAVELDRRKIRDRIAELREELVHVQKEADTRRSHRHDQTTIALVGYTNAGKSSWMRRLTGGEVYVADKLFATLDTTIRVLVPETRPRILVSDTVGFIKKLPHDLVASFRSTLEEARDADLLLHVVDAADPAFRSQLEVTKQVLSEVHADGAPSLLLLNKVDKISEADQQALRLEFPDALLVCAKDDASIKFVHQTIVTYFEKDMVDDEFVVPYAQQAFVHRIHEAVRVVEENYDEVGATVKVRGTADTIARLRSKMSS